MGRAGAILRPILPSLRSDSVVQARCLLRRPEVIAVTYRQDLGADLVVAECYRRGIDIWRFNTEDFPATVGITLNPANPYQTLFVSDRAEISFETAGIWLRRPQWPRVSDDITDPIDRELASQESLATLGGLWRLLSDRCVSPADAMQSARWKLHQLRVASELGLAVPETLVTTDSKRASDFLADGFVVVKAITDVRIADRDGEIYTLTESVDAQEATDSVQWS